MLSPAHARPKKLWTLLALVALHLASWGPWAELADARSGGSAGGGSFGGGSSGSSRSSSSSSSRSSSSSSSRSSSSGSSRSSSSGSGSSSRSSSSGSSYGSGSSYSGGSSGCTGGSKSLWIALAMFGGFWWMVGRGYVGKKRPRASSNPAPAQAEQMSVVALEVGIQAQAKTGIREVVEGLARTGNLDTPQGLHAFMQEIVVHLHRHKDAIDYAHIQVNHGMSAEQAQELFTTHSNEARSRYDREILRRDAAGLRTQERNKGEVGGLLDEDGQLAVDEYLVLTLLVGFQGREPFPKQIDAHEQLVQALRLYPKVTPTELKVVEAIWSPAAESDTMTKQDMLETYAELRRL